MQQGNAGAAGNHERPQERTRPGCKFNPRLRDECLNVIKFMSLDDARAKMEAW